MKQAMKGVTKIVIVLLIVAGGVLVWKFVPQRSEQTSNKTGAMEIRSSAFESNQSIPPEYTCTGEDVNPPLEIKEVPEQAESLVLVVDDPDAPAGTWIHWTVWNISPKVGKIEENSVPPGAVEGMTDFGEPGYGGPCPPSGQHRYRFKVFALDKKLDLPRGAEKEELDRAREDFVIEKDRLVGVYSK